MGAGRQTESHDYRDQVPRSPGGGSGYLSARNLSKQELAGVIFGCKHHTMKECLSNMVFGLPDPHFSYIKNIEPGLPLFLFNYSDRKLHGIYEAAGCGMKNINPYGWTANGSDPTEYPAQVRARVRKQCQPLSEEQFRDILHMNYNRDRKRFWFELDQTQTDQLISLFDESNPYAFTYNKPIKTPIYGDTPNPDTRHRDEPGLPAESPPPALKWISLFRDNSGSDSRKEEDNKPPVSTTNWDEENSPHLNGHYMDSTSSGISASWDVETRPSEFVNWEERCASWSDDETKKSEHCTSWSDDKTKKSEHYTSWADDETEKSEGEEEHCTPSANEAISLTPCEDETVCEETQIVNSEEEAIEGEEERVYSKLKQLLLNREDSTAGARTKDALISSATDDDSHLEDGWSPAAHLATEKENSNTDIDAKDIFFPCGTDTLLLEDGRSSPTLSTSEKDNSGTKDDSLCEKCNLPVDIQPLTTSENCEKVAPNLREMQSLIHLLRQKLKDERSYSLDQHHKAIALEKKLEDSETLVQQLQNRIIALESEQDHLSTVVEVSNDSSRNEVLAESADEPGLGVDEMIFIMGGYDGISWLPTLESYSPSRDIVKSLKPMSSVRSYSAAAVLKGLVYNFGGWSNNMWYDTVEYYNSWSNNWISCPSLSVKKGCLVGACLNDKIFAAGGGNGQECFKEVEMFDATLGKWIPTQSMLEKRFASAAAELDGVLYVVGGYDGKTYVNSAERFDPREASWSKIGCMDTSRGSHAMTVYKGQLYALGGYDGNSYVSSVEIMDPRMGSWVAGAEMKQPRGYFSATVIGDGIHCIGGQGLGNNIVETVDRYKAGDGWSTTNLKGIGKRCFFSSVSRSLLLC